VTDRQLLYFGDPMCSWCWGFSPVIQAMSAHVGERAPVHVIVGGLYLGVTDPMTGEAKARVRGHWERVHELTGQPFDFGFFAREGFVYDTGRACRAVVAARRLDPPCALPFLAHLHRAFYARNRDLTDPVVLADEAEAFGLDRIDFETTFEDEETAQVTLWDFNTARRLGATAYPTVLAKEGSRAAAITVGHQPWADLQPVIDAWLAGEATIG